MKLNRAQVLAWTYAEEGGFVIRASEPGGAGNLGLSFKLFQGWMALHGKPHVTFADLQKLNELTAAQIYSDDFLDPIRFDQLASGADYAFFNAAVNLGVPAAVMMLQGNVLKFPSQQINGHMDSITMAALGRLSGKFLPQAINDEWLLAKRASHEWPEFGPGWTNRYKRVRERITAMTGAAS